MSDQLTFISTHGWFTEQTLLSVGTYGWFFDEVLGELTSNLAGVIVGYSTVVGNLVFLGQTTINLTNYITPMYNNNRGIFQSLNGIRYIKYKQGQDR